MSYSEKYKEWLEYPFLDNETKEELQGIEGQDKEIEDRFYRELSFGTGGLRGVLGAGSNRMNKYTVRRATQGLANYLNKNTGKDTIKVAIACDSRNFSDVFSLEASLVLAANNIKVYLFDELRPTPELSFAVRELGCDAGIVVTASHNPPEYNGYKVYGEDGGQITLEMAEGVIGEIGALDTFYDMKSIKREDAEEKGLLNIIGEEIDMKYLEKVVELSLRKDIAREVPDYKIVYTPIHGSGLKLVTRALDMLGYKNITLVKSQAEPDGDFPTVKSPNPEERAAFEEGIIIAEDIDADILFGTDPDCDRIGVVARNDEGQYQVFTGNQIGALITHYILSSKESVTKKDAVIKTIVTSELGGKIAESFGATVFDTLTGFKFIGEKIKGFEESGSHDFVFGYEESYGYLAGTFVRDKDAVIASILIAEMAAYYNTRGMSLFEALEDIYDEYGYYMESLDSIVFKGIEGQNKIKETVEKFRDTHKILQKFSKVESVEDYQLQKRKMIDSGIEESISLPQSNVIKIHFEDDAWIAIRPSGTEPKLKIYYSAVAESRNMAQERLNEIKELVAEFVE